MSEQGESRIAEARRRASDAKQKLGIAAAAGFVAVLGLAYASHPGESTSSTAPATGTTVDQGRLTQSDDFEQDDDFDFGSGSSGSIAPSTGAAPQAQTHVS